MVKATRPCPAPGCKIGRKTHQVACRTHWYAIPAPLRQEILQANKQHVAEPSNVKHRERHRQAVVAAVRGLRSG